MLFLIYPNFTECTGGLMTPLALISGNLEKEIMPSSAFLKYVKTSVILRVGKTLQKNWDLTSQIYRQVISTFSHLFNLS